MKSSPSMKAKLMAFSFVLAASTLSALPPGGERPPPPPEERKATDLAAEVKAAHQGLAHLRLRYDVEHPKVRAQVRKIADLERQVAQEKAKQPQEPNQDPEPTALAGRNSP